MCIFIWIGVSQRIIRYIAARNRRNGLEEKSAEVLQGARSGYTRSEA
jgi:hypothetical protein